MLRTILFALVIACFANGHTLAINADAALSEEAGSTIDNQNSAKSDKTDHGNQAGDSILWEEPADLEQRDLFYGRGGKEGAPNPAGRYTFIRRSTSGTSKKITVKDDKGREWVVKFGREARPETTATRIVWAVGYHVDQNYFVKHAHIRGWGDVQDVRFERRDERFEEVGTWSWIDNPLNDSRELQGLKVLLIGLLKNWDLKTVDNKILRPVATSNMSNKRIYYVDDLGGTLGATGSFINRLRFLSDLPPDQPFRRGRGKGNPEAFSQEGFIQAVNNGEVKFHHIRKRGRTILKGISVENARWMGNLLGRLSDKQLTDAFRAGNFNDAEITIYLNAFRERIRQLRTLGEGTEVASPAQRDN